MASQTVNDPLIGTLVAGRYKIERRLSQGGMGAIYIATQEPLGRRVALKVLLEEFARNELAMGRFEKEAKAISRLIHPHIVTLFDFGWTEAGEMYIAMEFLEGRSLRGLLDDVGPLPWRRSVSILRGVLRGLEEAHRHRIIHRDLKPENIVLVRSGDDDYFPKILDFGLARTIDTQNEGDRLTQANMIPGTPAYISPERVNGVGDDARSDLYAVGAIWFELLTGRAPFMGETAVKTIVKHIQDPIPDLDVVSPDSTRPAGVAELITSLLQKRPEERPESARTLLRMLDSLAGDEQWSALSPSEFGDVPHSGLSEWAESVDSSDIPFFNVEDGPVEEPAAEPLLRPKVTADELPEATEPIALTQRKQSLISIEELKEGDEDTIIPLTKRKEAKLDTRPDETSTDDASEPSAVDSVLDSALESATGGGAGPETFASPTEVAPLAATRMPPPAPLTEEDAPRMAAPLPVDLPAPVLLPAGTSSAPAAAASDVPAGVSGLSPASSAPPSEKSPPDTLLDVLENGDSVFSVARSLSAKAARWFERVLVVDLRERPPSVLAQRGFPTSDGVGAALERAAGFWELVASKEPFYGRAPNSPDWKHLHRELGVAHPEALLVACLRKSGRPTLAILGEHMATELKDLGDLAADLRTAAERLNAIDGKD